MVLLILIEYEYFSNKFISPIDGALISITTTDQSGPRSNSNERYSTLPISLKLELHHQIQLDVIPKILLEYS